VDSGHTNFQGYNHVICVGRVKTEADKIKICSSLKKMDGSPIIEPGDSILYSPPHDEFGAPNRAKWPTTAIVQLWKDWGCVQSLATLLLGFSVLLPSNQLSVLFSFEPSVLILGPGEHIHLNKGRLHAFRKFTFDPLHRTDCHYQLHTELCTKLRNEGMEQSPLCISIAYDW
jgi:hypothetical protein